MEKLVIVFATKWCAQMALQYIGKNVAGKFQKQPQNSPTTNGEDVICIPTKGLGEEEDFLYLKRFSVHDMIEETLVQFMTRFQELKEENLILKQKLEEEKMLAENFQTGFHLRDENSS